MGGIANVSRESEGKIADDWISFENLFRDINEEDGGGTLSKQSTMQSIAVPLHINPIDNSDDVSDVSNVSNSTPFSTVHTGSPCAAIPSLKTHNSSSDATFVSGAATVLKQTVINLVDDIAVSMNPSTLMKFQGRTRSVVDRSLNMAWQLKPSQHYENFIFKNDVYLSSSANINTTSPALRLQHARSAATQKCSGRSRREVSCHHLSSRHRSLWNNVPLHRCEIEVPYHGAIMDCSALGEEVEITRHHASLLLDSRDMGTEIVLLPQHMQHTDSNYGLVGGGLDRTMQNASAWRRRLAVPRFLRLKPQENEGRRRDTAKKSIIVVGTRGSGKTVSTMHSDESTNLTAMQSMHTDGSAWIQEADIVRILQS